MAPKQDNKEIVAETVVEESNVESDASSDNEVTHDTNNTTSDDSKKSRKSRKSKASLTDILSLLRDHETKKAIALLESYIESNGDRATSTIPKKKRGSKREDGELNPYQLFMRNKMKDIKDANPGMAHNEIMKLAVAEWNVQKNA